MDKRIHEQLDRIYEELESKLVALSGISTTLRNADKTVNGASTLTADTANKMKEFYELVKGFVDQEIKLVNDLKDDYAKKLNKTQQTIEEHSISFKERLNEQVQSAAKLRDSIKQDVSDALILQLDALDSTKKMYGDKMDELSQKIIGIIDAHKKQTESAINEFTTLTQAEVSSLMDSSKEISLKDKASRIELRVNLRNDLKSFQKEVVDAVEQGQESLIEIGNNIADKLNENAEDFLEEYRKDFISSFKSTEKQYSNIQELIHEFHEKRSSLEKGVVDTIVQNSTRLRTLIDEKAYKLNESLLQEMSNVVLKINRLEEKQIESLISHSEAMKNELDVIEKRINSQSKEMKKLILATTIPLGIGIIVIILAVLLG